ncbi:MAG: hypothetical protein WEC75_07760 [Dehalococcoidia bacterium]
MDTQVFRILLWQKLIPVAWLPFLAGLWAISPIGRTWPAATWIIAGVAVGGGVLLYFGAAWLRSAIILDDRGMTLWLRGEQQTWPYEKLIKVKGIGRYRARMCWDPDVPDMHRHISIDLFGRDRFMDTLLDRYEETTGRELPELEHEKAA